MDIKNYFTIKNITFFLLILFVIFMIVKMPDVTLLLFFGYLISSAINPIVDKLQSKMPRSAAVVLMIMFIFLLILGVFAPIIIMSASEIKSFLENLPGQIDKIQNWVSALKIGGDDIAQYVNFDSLLSNSTNIAKTVIDKSIDFTIGIVGALTILVTIGIIVFFLSNDKAKIKDFVLTLFPSDIRERTSVVIDNLETKVGGYVSAQLLCITIVGLVVTVCLALLRVDYSIFLGFISAVLDLVPVVGPFLACVLILLVAAQKGWIIAILAVFSFLLAQFIENNWARPYFFSKYMDLHPLVVILSFIIAAKVLGVVGVLIAPAIAAVLVTLFDEIYVKTINNEDGAQEHE